MAVDLYCGSLVEGLPELCVDGSPLRIMSGFYRINRGEIFTETEAAALSNYITKVIAKTLLPAHKVFNIEDVSVEKKVQESALGRKKDTHPGYRGYKLYFDFNEDQKKVMKSWEGQAFDIIPYDADGNIMFRSLSGDNLGGFPIAYFSVEKDPVITDANSKLTAVEIQEEDINDMYLLKYLNPRKATLIADRWSATDVKSITKATLTSGAIAGGIFTLTVKYYSTSEMKDGAEKELPVTGGGLANLVLKDGTGAVVAPDAVTETSTPGIYIVDASTAVYTGGTAAWIPVNTDKKLVEADAIVVS